jgi:hypothetical protein
MFFNKLAEADFHDEKVRLLVTSIHDYIDKNNGLNITKWVKKLDSEDANYVNKLQLLVENEFAEAKEDDVDSELYNAVMRLKHENIEREKNEISEKMAICQRDNDSKEKLKLMAELQQIIVKERNM